MHKTHLTLVELLVVLMILATAGALTTTSIETTQGRQRSSETVKKGQDITAALERSEGLSFVSDLGRLPIRKEGSEWSWNEDELRLLYASEYKKQDGSSFTVTPYRLFDLKTAAGKLSGLATAVTNSNVLNMQLGGGWRGPYCSMNFFQNKTAELTDGWGHAWDLSGKVTTLSAADESFTLKSLGRDGMESGLSGAGTDWQDREILFTLQKNYVMNAELTVKLDINSALTVEAIGFVYFSPYAVYSSSKLTAEMAAASAEISTLNSVWSSLRINPAQFSLTVEGNTRNFILRNLYTGQKALMVYARNSGGGFAFSQLHIVHIKPGTNSLAVKLGY